MYIETLDCKTAPVLMSRYGEISHALKECFRDVSPEFITYEATDIRVKDVNPEFTDRPLLWVGLGRGHETEGENVGQREDVLFLHAGIHPCMRLEHEPPMDSKQFWLRPIGDAIIMCGRWGEEMKSVGSVKRHPDAIARWLMNAKAYVEMLLMRERRPKFSAVLDQYNEAIERFRLP